MPKLAATEFIAHRAGTQYMSSSNRPTEPNAVTSTVVVGGTTITMQQLQQMHADLTGKAESISKYYEDPIRLSLPDIDNIHHRLAQTWEQYHVVSTTTSITVYYSRNTTEHFSSLDRFRLQASGGAEPIESVLLKYDLVVVLPNLAKPQRWPASSKQRFALDKWSLCRLVS